MLKPARLKILGMSACIFFLSSLIILISRSSAYENIAYKRPAWQRTTHPSGFGPDKAVDGLKSNLSASGHQCSISANYENIASLSVNLLGIKFIHHLLIYYRTDNNPWGENNSLAGRFLGFAVYISDTENKDDGRLCFHDNEYNMSTIPAVANITCELYGQYVIYYNERRNDTVYPIGYSKYAYSELCEVEVYGCSQGIYGPNCLYPCPTHCPNCNAETGTCLWCEAGYIGEYCNSTCAQGTFGVNCTSICGECTGNCDHRFGNCSQGCKAGFKGITCDEVCDFGFHGVNCQQECSMFCFLSKNCSRISGQCMDGCKPGWDGLDCLEMRKQETKEIFSSTETIAVLAISLSFNACLLLAFCINRYDATKNKSLLKAYISKPRKEKMTTGVQTGPIDMGDGEQNEREYTEPQYLQIISQNYYNTA